MAAGILPGCKTTKAEPDRPPVTRKGSTIPLRPITREIIQLARENGVDIKNFQYYISTTIKLEQQKITRSMEIDSEGAGILKNISTSRTVIINKETKGKYITSHPHAINPAVIEICFDKDNENDTLFFTASPDGKYFSLKLESEKSQTIKYGGEIYDLWYPDSPDANAKTPTRHRPDPIPPQLLIRFDERMLSVPDIQVVPGNNIEE
ncbi:hypothetical protein FACS1894110_05000 [Spirochaetia bacterium]|nr:hypothetical protein FACS1894110_05000 [Spirochaetia bacterium]